ncbi:hypothetical protein BJ165DRAFT_1535065 [Panaeolus papilionaceus]|nr:hypothetical protein BJ165DRAFT_1535065 [Panaeolus papilionaceus]
MSGQSRLLSLTSDAGILETFQELGDDDVKASTLMVKGNSVGSREVALALSWIWRSKLLARAPNQLDLAAQERMDSVAHEEFLRIHWLRARALFQRWQEEIVLVTHEMSWTVRFFTNRASNWKQAALNPQTSQPAAAYAYRKQHACLRIATHADMIFKTFNMQYVSPM